MLIWLVIVFVSLAGLLMFVQSGVAGTESSPALPAALAVMAILAIVYLAATRPRRDDKSKLGSFIAGALAACIFAAGLGLKSGTLWKLATTAASARGGDAGTRSRETPGSVRLRKKADGHFPLSFLRKINFLAKFVDRLALKLFPGLFGFQFIFVAKKKS